ncbi:MAG: hypothetical protein HC902_00770 [Calothrix sp. SM1_5_4]|nr:hypothetical protein [Calothrix sp. SM1_5_4]
MSVNPSFNYLGRVSYATALSLQERRRGEILAFESDPVVTMGVRAGAEDLKRPESFLRAQGFDLLRVDRGGQATLHAPGQLVIFPALDVSSWGAARAWIGHLVGVTQACARELGQEFAVEAGGAWPLFR